MASQIKEHMEVKGSDSGHIRTADCVEGDRIKLTNRAALTGTWMSLNSRRSKTDASWRSSRPKNARVSCSSAYHRLGSLTALPSSLFRQHPSTGQMRVEEPGWSLDPGEMAGVKQSLPQDIRALFPVH